MLKPRLTTAEHPHRCWEVTAEGRAVREKHTGNVQPSEVHPETSARLLAHQASGYSRHVNHTVLSMLFAHQVYSIMP